MGLVMTMVLVERVIQVTVHPRKLRDVTKVERHLSISIAIVVISSSNRVETLVEIRVHDIVTPVVVGLLPIILRHV